LAAVNTAGSAFWKAAGEGGDDGNSRRAKKTGDVHGTKTFRKTG
jgi:hypothetical protein